MHQNAQHKRALACAAALFLIGSVVVGCVRNPATRKVHARLLSAQAEVRIGEETKKRILEQYKALDNEEVQAYVDRIGQRLAMLSDRPTVDYSFTVLDHDLINAFAAPGGFIFVTRGLLESVGDESELAMVLAHEIAHVAAMHGVQMIQKEMGQNALTILGTIGAAIAAGPEAMLLMANTADLFSALYLLGYSREKESEADYLGLQYLLRAGYDPNASLRFLKKLASGDDDAPTGWDFYFRTHPPVPERIEAVRRLVGEERRDEPQAQQDAFAQMKALLPHIEAGDRGIIDGQTFFDPAHRARVTVPANWNLGFVYPQALVSFHTHDQRGEGRLQVVELGNARTAEDVAFRFAQESGFRHLKGRHVLYQAGYGYLGQFEGLSAIGRPLHIRLFATIRRGHGFILMAGAPHDRAASYSLDLEQIMRGLTFS